MANKIHCSSVSTWWSRNDSKAYLFDSIYWEWCSTLFLATEIYQKQFFDVIAEELNMHVIAASQQKCGILNATCKMDFIRKSNFTKRELKNYLLNRKMWTCWHFSGIIPYCEHLNNYIKDFYIEWWFEMLSQNQSSERERFKWFDMKSVGCIKVKRQLNKIKHPKTCFH